MTSKPTSDTRISKAEQRVIIAKDALAQLKAERFIAEQGSYIHPEVFDELCDMIDDEEAIFNTQAKPWLKKLKIPCRVCAKGALFLSAVRKYNKATVEDVGGDNLRVAEVIFGEKQFDLIEAAFEQWETTKSREYPYADGDSVPKAYEFGMRYEGETERLVAILQNIVKNNGTFKP